MTATHSVAPLDPQVVRAEFPILSTTIHDNVPLVYLDNAASTQRPRAVIDKLVEVYEKHYANVHRGIHWLSDQSTDLYEESRAAVQRFINAAASEEVIFTRGTTESINLVARSWGDANVKSGDEIVVTEMEHHSNLVPWHQLSERTGCKIRGVGITDDGLLRMDQLREILNERTRLVAVTAVSNVLGTRNPLPEIIAAAHEAGALVLVDAAQLVPHEKVDVQALDADFLAFSGHKMLGPSGVGVLYGKQALLDAMPPFMGGGSMINSVKIDSFTPADLPAKFEAGTPPIVSAIGLKTAIEFLEGIGLEAIAQHEQLLARRAHELMEELGGVHFLGPAPEHKTGIVSFTLTGLKGGQIHAHDVAQLLDQRGIAIRAGHHCTEPLHTRLGINASARASFYCYNTLEEVEQLVEGLSSIKQVFRRR